MPEDDKPMEREMTNREQEKRNELLGWAKQGIHDCIRSTRGANMFGAGATVFAADGSTLVIQTRDADGPTTWELKLTKKV